MSINAIIGNNGILTQAQNAVLSQRLATYKEDFEYKLVELQIAGESTSIYAISENVQNYIESLDGNDVGTIAIYDGSLVYLSNSTSDIEVATNLGYITMSDEDYNYMLELTLIENAILSIEENSGTRVGLQMGTNEYGQVTVAGINYGLGWYIIGSDEDTFSDELSELGITDTDIMTHYPYIVKYTTGAVQSTVGKMMYAGTDTEIWKYTFNYTGEEGGIVVANLLSGVTSDSTQTSTQYGNFTNISSEFAYDTDEYGNECLVLDGTTAGNMEVDQTVDINSAYSFLITIKGTTNQHGNSSYDLMYPDGISYHGNTPLAISDDLSKYVGWISICDNILRIYSYRQSWKLDTSSSNGYTYLDISEYDNKYMSIQLTVERDGESNLYINGILKSTFDSGNEVFSYNYLTIGDLREGRGLYYIGNIYNVAIYGSCLSEDEVAQNWNYVSTELGIDENGDKVN